ncbi:hypothetical protein SUSAZ_00605 [Sulfolobus acidocaldarius SUSAZ]|nr:hypothetical protein SUSAZ_00605 [Sulfolobus acidocaldarius SUSAZ]
MNDSVFEISKLNVWLNGKHVLKEIDEVRITKNSVFSIMGPSGSGKSTLLKTLNRLIELNNNVKIEGEIYKITKASPFMAGM